MRAFIIAAVLLGMAATAALADGMYWVVGNRATNTCDIVTKNPVIDGDIYFGTGPYRSLDDAKLARSTIFSCPKDDDRRPSQ